MHPADRPNPLTTWLLAIACILVACVPVHGATICLHGDHFHLGTVSEHDHDHPLQPHHRDIELDSLDEATPASGSTFVLDAPEFELAFEPGRSTLDESADAPWPRSRGSTAHHRLRIVGTVVLLI